MDKRGPIQRVLLLLTCFLISWTRAKTLGFEMKSICSTEEEQDIQLRHVQCTKQVEERYALLAGNLNPALPSPAGIALSAASANPLKQDPIFDQICGMLHEVVEKCGQIYEKCYKKEDFRKFKDYQLEIFLQLMGSLYNLGNEVKQCDIVQEYDRSGRRQVIKSTTLCKEENVTSLTIKYQQCIEDANVEMTGQMQINIKSMEKMFESLCYGMHQVVHGCGDLLHECYSREEIMETKLGQLELTKRVFDDLTRDLESDSSQFRDFNFDISHCPVYSGSVSVVRSHTTTWGGMILLSAVTVMLLLNSH